MAAQLVPYRDDAVEFPRLIAYLREIWRHPGFLMGDFHIGDVVWQRFRTGFDAGLRIGLWEDGDGRVVGFTWYDGPDELVVSIHPEVLPTPAAGELLDGMLAWGEERRATYAERGEPSERLATGCLREDARSETLLTERGFVPDGVDAFRVNRRSLLDELPERPVAEGYQIVDITDEGLIPERVALHREVWHPSKLTEESYRWLRSRPEFDPELDLMAVSADGEGAAYAICWMDAETRTALFEPVGTRASHRRRGLAAAVLAEGMRRARAKGAETINVLNSSAPEYAPSSGLYASVGFRPVGHLRYWRRPGAPSDRSDDGLKTSDDRV